MKRMIALFAAAACILSTMPAMAAPKAPTDRDIAAALMTKVARKSKTIHSLSADIVQVKSGDDLIGPVYGHIDWKAPNYYRIELWFKGKTGPYVQDKNKPHKVLVSDGKTNYFVDVDGKLLKSQANQANGTDFIDIIGNILGSKYVSRLQIAKGIPIRLLDENWNGRVYRVIESTPPAHSEQTGNLRIYVGRDNVVRRILEDVHSGDFHWYEDSYVENLRVNSNIPQSQFAFTYPEVAHTWREQLADERTTTDEKSRELLKSAMMRVHDLGSIAATSTSDVTYYWAGSAPRHSRTVTHVKLLRPGYLRFDATKTGVLGSDALIISKSTVIAGANDYWEAVTDERTSRYAVFSASTHVRQSFLDEHHSPLLRDYFDIDRAPFYLRFGLDDIRYVGEEIWNGATYDVLVGKRAPFKSTDPSVTGPNGKDMRIYIGQDRLIHRIVDKELTSTGEVITREDTLTDIDLSPKLALDEFRYNPPPGAEDVTNSVGHLDMDIGEAGDY